MPQGTASNVTFNVAQSECVACGSDLLIQELDREEVSTYIANVVSIVMHSF